MKGAGLRIRFDDAKRFALLKALEANPRLRRHLFFSPTESSTLCPNERSDLLFAFTIDFLGPIIPSWIEDMVKRGLIERDGAMRWRKSEIWAERLVKYPTARQVMTLRALYVTSRRKGMKDEWKSWEEVKKADKALHDTVKVENPYYFDVHRLYELSAAENSSVPATSPSLSPCPAILADRLSAPMTGGSEVGKVSTNFESGQKRQRKRSSAGKDRDAVPEVGSAVKRSRTTSTSAKSRRFEPNLASQRPPSRRSSSAARPHRLVSEAPSDMSLTSWPDANLGDCSTAHYPSSQPISGGPSGNAAGCNPSDQSSAASTGHQPQPSATNQDPRVLAPWSSSDDALLDALLGSTNSPRLPSDTSASGQPPVGQAAKLAEIPAVKAIDWSNPIYTVILLEAIDGDQLLRAALMPDTISSLENAPPRSWKLQRDLYLRMMLAEPGQGWIKKATGWRWVGEKPGHTVLKATLLWTQSEVYGFKERLIRLKDSWTGGRFGLDFPELERSAEASRRCQDRMRSLFGDPGQLAPAVESAQPSGQPPPDQLTTSSFTLSATPPPTYSPHSYDPRDSYFRPAPPREHLQKATRLPDSPPITTLLSAHSWPSHLPLRPQSPALPYNSSVVPIGDRPTSSLTHADCIELIRVASSAGLRVADLPRRWRREWAEARSDAGARDVFEMGKADMYAEGIIGVVTLGPRKSRKTFDKVAYNLDTIPCRALRDSLQHVIDATGGKRIGVSHMDDVPNRHGDHRFRVHLFRERSSSLEQQVCLGVDHIHDVGLLEYLERVADWATSY